MWPFLIGSILYSVYLPLLDLDHKTFAVVESLCSFHNRWPPPEQLSFHGVPSGSFPEESMTGHMYVYMYDGTNKSTLFLNKKDIKCYTDYLHILSGRVTEMNVFEFNVTFYTIWFVAFLWTAVNGTRLWRQMKHNTQLLFIPPLTIKLFTK